MTQVETFPEHPAWPALPSPEISQSGLCGARACQTHCVNLCARPLRAPGPPWKAPSPPPHAAGSVPRAPAHPGPTASPSPGPGGASAGGKAPLPRAESGALSVVRPLGVQLPLWDRQAGSGSLARPLPRSRFWPIGAFSRSLEAGVEWGAGIRPPGSSLGCSHRVSHFLCPDALTPGPCSL